jgi:hypothetical protein
VEIFWFNAWEYENLDPMLALMQRIALEFRGTDSKIKNVIKGFLLLSADIFVGYQGIYFIQYGQV